MKKLALLLLTFIMILAVPGCSNTDLAAEVSDDNDFMQTVYDMSEKVEGYTEELFKTMLKEQGITDYEIEETSRGFITDDPVIYITGYRYICDGSEAVYGYKLRMNDNQTFSVIEEGVQVGEFIMG